MHAPSLVRTARPADRGVIARLTLAAYREFASLMDPDAWRALDQAIRTSLADDTNVTRVVAELDGAIVGSAALYAPDSAAYGSLAELTPWPEVRLVAVDPAARGRGVARELRPANARTCTAGQRSARGRRRCGRRLPEAEPADLRREQAHGVRSRHG